MIPHHCKVKHDPPHSYGDCLRASIASLLNVERTEDVPHFLHDGNGENLRDRMNEYLHKHYVHAYWMAFDGSSSVSEIRNAMANNNPNTYYLLFGKTSTGIDHVLICLNDKVVHDTSWLPYNINEPNADGNWMICILIPLIMVSDA